MSHHNCTNCEKELTDNYCSRCGQKANTHRFSTRHIFAHDFIHGVFHLDKGFLFTSRELLTRPGYSIREYIEGKRVNHFNYITFILLLITANVVALVPGNTAKLVFASLNIPITLIYTIRFYTQYFSKDYKSKFWLKMRAVFAAQIVPIIVAGAIGLSIYAINPELLIRLIKAIGAA